MEILSSILSAMTGALAGGLISWWITPKIAKKKIDYVMEKELDVIEQKKKKEWLRDLYQNLESICLLWEEWVGPAILRYKDQNESFEQIEEKILDDVHNLIKELNKKMNPPFKIDGELPIEIEKVAARGIMFYGVYRDQFPNIEDLPQENHDNTTFSGEFSEKEKTICKLANEFFENAYWLRKKVGKRYLGKDYPVEEL